MNDVWRRLILVRVNGASVLFFFHELAGQIWEN